jgi:hypothetical protein
VVSDVLVDNETPMMTSRISRFSAQSFEMLIMGFRTCVHNERVGICVVLCCVV